MSSVCPTCNSDLDPTHAPAARVRGGRVVAYCSKACAQSDDTGAVALPKVSAKAGGESAKSEAAPNPSTAPSESAPSEIAGSEDAKPAQPSSRGRRRRVLWASAAIMVGGMAVAVVPVIAPTASTSVSAAADSAPASKTKETPPPSPPEVVLDPRPLASPSNAELRSKAIAALEQDLQTGAPRFQRLAGLALAKLSHEGALAFLGERLKSESSDLSRVDIAYGLALGNDGRGRTYLINQLKNARRDVRVDAARRLVELGDDSGRMTLVQMLGIKSHRLGAAAQLALLGDQRGIEVLRQSFTSSDSSAETKMRAAVGLGRAGDRSAAGFLKKILSEGRFVVDAAGALAALGERDAIPALRKQLELTSIRVRAAASLQRMAEPVDLGPLARALESGTPEGRIAAAEAILLLSTEEQK